MLRDAIGEEAARLGFPLVGIAPALTPHGVHDLVRWIDAGYAAEMTYFADRLPAYHDPNLVLGGVRSIIVMAMPYRTAKPRDALTGQGRIARYAIGSEDYHDVIHDRLKMLGKFIRSLVPECEVRGVVDSAPVMEREFAQMAGLGWRAKNSLLINRDHGSYFFLACLLTTLDLPASRQFETDHCGTCTRCLDACPTDAFVMPGVLDSRLCISYLTIENRGVIPRELREPMGNWLFGCDVCQDVCPWNRFGEPSPEAAFQTEASYDPVDLLELISIDEATFRSRFRKTPMWRARRRGLIRNAAIVLGNSRDCRAIEPLERLCTDPEPLIRGAVYWALAQISMTACLEAIAEHGDQESDQTVREEIDAIINSGDCLAAIGAEPSPR